jgi:hypothetical protein
MSHTFNIKIQHIQYDFKDMSMMLQPAESEHGGDFTIGRVPTATVFDLATCSLGCLQVLSDRSVALLVGHLHNKGGRKLLALGVYATRVGAKQRYRTVAAA